MGSRPKPLLHRRSLSIAFGIAFAVALMAASGLVRHADAGGLGARAAFHVDPGYPDMTRVTEADRQAARTLWLRSKRFARKYLRTPAEARRHGFQGNLSRVRRPAPFFFHFRNMRNYRDGREIDPRRPEAIVYWYEPPKRLVLVGFMFQSRHHREPAVGRTIFPWHSHCVRDLVVMHAWFTNDLRSAFARRAPRPEFEEVFTQSDFGDPTPDSAAGCPPPPHH